MKVSSTRRTPIGLDVDGRSIAAVQFCNRAGARRMENAAVFRRLNCDVPISATEVSRLAGLLDRRGFHGNSVVLGVSDRMLLTGLLELPPATTAAPLGQIARMEMARIHQCEPASFECGFWPLPATGRGGETSLAMAAACPCEDANHLLDVFEHHGLDVQALDALPLARARSCSPLIENHSGVTALLDIRWDATALSVLHQKAVVYERSLTECGLSALQKAITSTLSLSDDVADLLLFGGGDSNDAIEVMATTNAYVGTRRHVSKVIEAIVREVKASCGYVSNRFAAAMTGEVLLIGPGARIPEVNLEISTAADMPVRIVSPALFSTINDQLREIGGDPTITTAAGLAQFEA